MATFDKRQLRSPKTPTRSEKSPATPTRNVSWQNQAMAAMVARTPSKATPPRSRSARQRHEAKNGDVVARTTRELEHGHLWVRTRDSCQHILLQVFEYSLLLHESSQIRLLDHDLTVLIDAHL